MCGVDVDRRSQQFNLVGVFLEQNINSALVLFSVTAQLYIRQRLNIIITAEHLLIELTHSLPGNLHRKLTLCHLGRRFPSKYEQIVCETKFS